MKKFDLAALGWRLPVILLAGVALAACGSGGSDSGSGSSGGNTNPTIAISLTPIDHISWSVALGSGLVDQQESIMVHNYGNVTVDVTAESSVPWLAAMSFQGAGLQPQQSRSCQITMLASQVQGLSPGRHSGRIDFLVDGSSRNAFHVDLTVNQPQQGGWTELTPSQDSRIVYVSSSLGNDANSGLTEASPKQTIAAGKALMRHGFPDWLLLRRGDTWNEPIGHWRASGRSATEMMVISTYGTSPQRPLLLTGTAHGLFTSLGGGSPATIDHVAIIGIHFRANLYIGIGSPIGISWLVGGTNRLVEDCFFERFMNNLVFQSFSGTVQDTRLRRNVIINAFGTTASTSGQGLYASGCHGLLIEENVFDQNGWYEAVPGATPNIFRHGIYLGSGAESSTNRDVVVRGNIISNNSATGIQLRPGGLCEENLFLHNPINISLGGGHEPTPGGVDVICRRNVVLDGRDIDASNMRGWGIVAANIRSGLIEGNILAHQTSGQFSRGIDLESPNGSGVFNLAITNNVIYKWHGGPYVHIRGTETQVQGVSITGNEMQELQNPGNNALIRHESATTISAIASSGNRFHSNIPIGSWTHIGSQMHPLSHWLAQVGDTTSTSTVVSYPDPERNIATYMTSIGGNGGFAGFIAQARQQSKANWRPAYTAAAVNSYIRAGFGRSQ